MSTLLIAAMRMKSAARVRKHANVEGNGIAPRAAQAHRRADHHLLGDEVLVEAIRQHLLELVAEGGVLHVGVERDDTRVGFAELGERRAVRLARRDLIRPSVYAAARSVSVAAAAAAVDGFGICAPDSPRAGLGTNCFSSSASARSSSSPFLNALPCQPSLPFDERHALALHRRARIIVGWPLVARPRRARRGWRHVVPSMTMACQPNARQRRANCSMSCCHIVARLWPSAVHVGDAAQVVELVERGDVAASQTEPSAIRRRRAARRCGSRIRCGAR
jgi:hypothetical protein